MEKGLSLTPRNSKEVRCDCGSLIARLCKEGVELKCRRCKSLHIIPILSEKIG